MISIIASSLQDVQTIMDKVERRRHYSLSTVTFYECKYCGTNFVITITGYGKVNIGVGLGLLFDRYDITDVILVGNCGLIDSGARIGDIALSRNEIQYDVNFTPIGFEEGVLPGMATGLFPTDPNLLRIGACACDNLGFRNCMGNYVSGDRFVASNAIARQLKDTFDADFVDVECAPCGQICCNNNIPFICVKGISNLARNEAAREYLKNEKNANEQSSLVALEMIKLMSN